MFRNNFKFELAHLVRRQVIKDKIARSMQEFISKEVDKTGETSLDLKNLSKPIPSSIKRFIDIDGTWTSERVTNILWSTTTAEIDAQIAKLQQTIDDNAPVPGASSRKERSRTRNRKFALPMLKVFLAARALRFVEIERGLVLEDGKEPVLKIGLVSPAMQHWPYTLFNIDRLQAMQEARIEIEKLDAAAAKKNYMDRIKIELDGNSKKGQWEFKTEEDEMIARVFMRNFKTKEDEVLARFYMTDAQRGIVTAKDVVAEAKKAMIPSVLHDIGVIWVEKVEVNAIKRRREESPDAPTPIKKKPRLILKVGPRPPTSLEENIGSKVSIDSGSDSELTEFTEGSDAEDTKFAE